MRVTSFGCCIAMLFALLFNASAASAKDDAKTARAKIAFAEGENLYSVGRFEGAMAAYEEAFLDKPLPGLLFNVAQCHRMLGHHKDAARTYRRFLELLPGSPNRAEVEGLIAREEEAMKQAPPSLTPLAAPATPTPVVLSVEKPVDQKPAAPVVEVAKPATAKPLLIVAAPVTESAPPAVARPVYKKWWVWTLVAIAAVGGGVGLGLAFGLPKDAALAPGPATMVNFSLGSF